ncbi:cytochrome P450 [Penicillium malachiteum]|uniref:Cytochrome P450 n=1 Tax=Penicillium malachiteum TaxID=1324776 RepID=A0AAD6MW18_9EURO|nr:cytochrome P450 [Penicillium malachiteum]
MNTLQVLGPTEPIISSKTVQTSTDFKYLEACIKEVLRLHPIASEMGRRTGDCPIELMGYYLPVHTILSASYRQLHRSPEHWPEPLRFWPERRLEDRPQHVPAPDIQSYYPFSAGKHSCIGKNFALAEIRMLTANMRSKFDFTEVVGQNVDYRQYITMQFEHGSWKTIFVPRYTSEFEQALGQMRVGSQWGLGKFEQLWGIHIHMCSPRSMGGGWIDYGSIWALESR